VELVREQWFLEVVEYDQATLSRLFGRELPARRARSAELGAELGTVIID
jgi:hypothetical protein